MASAATDILPLARARFELRFPDSDNSQDLRLTELIGAAVSSVSEDISTPLVDQGGVVTVNTAGARPIVLRDRFLRSVDHIYYQAPSDVPVFGIYPTEISPDDYTVTDGQYGDKVVWPATTWPEAVSNAFLVEATVGIDPADRNLAAYTTATVLMFRSLYDGVTIVGDNTAYERVVRPLRRLDLSPFTLTGLAGGTIAPPLAQHHIRAGWSADATIDAADLTDEYQLSQFILPDGTGNLYLVLWRADADGGDFTEVHIAGAGNSRNLFGAAADLTIDTIPGKAIISATAQKAGLLSGESVRVV